MTKRKTAPVWQHGNGAKKMAHKQYSTILKIVHTVAGNMVLPCLFWAVLAPSPAAWAALAAFTAVGFCSEGAAECLR